MKTRLQLIAVIVAAILLALNVYQYIRHRQLAHEFAIHRAAAGLSPLPAVKLEALRVGLEAFRTFEVPPGKTRQLTDCLCFVNELDGYISLVFMPMPLPSEENLLDGINPQRRWILMLLSKKDVRVKETRFCDIDPAPPGAFGRRAR